jgi:hypothetical protein
LAAVRVSRHCLSGFDTPLLKLIELEPIDAEINVS